MTHFEVLSETPKTWGEWVNEDVRKRFERRVCEACRKPIHDHFKLNFKDVEMRSRKWCYRDGTQWSPALAVEDC